MLPNNPIPDPMTALALLAPLIMALVILAGLHFTDFRSSIRD